MWVDSIKMDLGETRGDGVDCIDIAQDRDQWRALVNTVLNLRVPQNAGKFLRGCTIGGLFYVISLASGYSCHVIFKS
jgi:hypothetical protein